MSRVGRLLSAMIYQNIGILIILGLIRALFGVYGWWPNEHFYLLYNAMVQYLIPVLLAYTGGRLVGKQKGGTSAAMVVFGLAVASSVPMIIGAMILGPLVGLLVGWMNKKMEKFVPVGFELLFVNLLISVVVLALTLMTYSFLGQALSEMIEVLDHAVETIIRSGWLPLTAVLIEPLKVMFFNNLLNHGILAPLGIQQAKDLGKSILFLLESNPGPGLGILLAYVFKTTHEQRRVAKWSSVIHFFGGIHEVYFPYVIRKPILILAVIAGGMTGTFLFQQFNAGLVSVSSPGSILFMAVLSPPDSLLGLFIGVAGSSLVSFIFAYPCLKFQADSTTAESKLKEVKMIQGLESIDSLNEMRGSETRKGGQSSESQADEVVESQRTGENTRSRLVSQPVKSIVFACDAGMGSSALGAAILRKKLAKKQMDIEVGHSSIYEVPEHADLVITHEKLTEMARKETQDKRHIATPSFTSNDFYDKLLTELMEVEQPPQTPKIGAEQILMNEKADDQYEAIRLIGRRMVHLGFVREGYIQKMIEREQKFSTYIGEGVAVPHGLTGEHSNLIQTPGIVLATFPDGIKFDGQTAYLLVGIAGYGERQVKILSMIARLIEEPSALNQIIQAKSVEEIVNIVNGAMTFDSFR
ncbi:MAG TPA: PTS sugar transporter subunit IIA [Bacillales bacterium]|nr:PTS sugar transporter subunit IIA [Bacillales bacterium]